MKFMFPNDLGIYLHDTPDKALFNKGTRHFSSGCVRLEDAPRLGK
jgi:murein L,D-transpeptidase YcbB/YkuD